jgi:hypothetical protein
LSVPNNTWKVLLFLDIETIRTYWNAAKALTEERSARTSEISTILDKLTNKYADEELFRSFSIRLAR